MDNKEPVMIGPYTVAAWEDMAAAITPTLKEEDIPALYALGADALYIFTDGQTGLWWVVETQAQADLLVATRATIRERVFTRGDLVEWFTKDREDDAAQAERADLTALPLLDLLKRGLLTDPVAVEQVAATVTDLPPGILTGEEPELERLGDEHNTWLRPVDAWAKDAPEVAAQLGQDFFLDDAWIVGANDVPTAIVATSQAQKHRLDSMNAEAITRGAVPFPAWGPTDLARYLGDAHVLFDAAGKARFVTSIQRAVAQATQQGQRIATARMVQHGAVTPLVGKVTLSLLVAHEMLGKSLLKCSEAELLAVQVAVGKLLLAAGAAGPIKAPDLPKPSSPPRDEGEAPAAGQYL